MLNEEIVEQIRKMKDEGKGISSIARELGLSRPTVLKYLGELGTNETGEAYSRKGLRGREHLSSRSGSLVQSMRDELETSKVEFEIEKIEDARSKWQERKDRERLERVEQEKGQRLEELRVRETQRIQMEVEEKERAIIQKLKQKILPLSAKQVLPASVMSSIYSEIEKILSRMNLIGVPFDELVILGQDVKNRIIAANAEAVRQSAYEYLTGLSRQVLKESLKQMFSDYRESGGELSFREFILANANSPDERETLLGLIT
jgi:predicted transcriptional regulator